MLFQSTVHRVKTLHSTQRFEDGYLSPSSGDNPKNHQTLTNNYQESCET